MPNLRCAIYTRKSSEEGLEQDFNSLDAQRESCAAYILSQRQAGWVVLPRTYSDGGFSGGNMARPGLSELLRDVEEGKIDIVVVYKVDRLTRSLNDFSKIIEAFDKRNVSFVSITQQFNTTSSMGRLTLNVLLTFAQFEREISGERLRDKIAASKKRGMYMGGNVPVGYDLKGRKLEVNPDDAKFVRGLFKQYLNIKNATRILQKLSYQGIRTKIRYSATGKQRGGAVYTRNTLYYILSNRTYLGEIAHKGSIHKGQHPPIIDKQIFNKVQRVLSSNRNKFHTKLRGENPNLLSGLIFDQSGQRLIPGHSPGKGKSYRFYGRPSSQEANSSSRKMRISAYRIEALIAERISSILCNAAYLSGALGLSKSVIRRTVAHRRKFLAGLHRSSQHYREICQTLINKIVVGDSDISIHLNKSGVLLACGIEPSHEESRQGDSAIYI